MCFESLGLLAIPLGLPEATVWVIRGEGQPKGSNAVHCCSLLLMSSQLSPHYPPECQPTGTVLGLDIMSAGYHYLYIYFFFFLFFPPDRFGLVCSCAFGETVTAS